MKAATKSLVEEFGSLGDLLVESKAMERGLPAYAERDTASLNLALQKLSRRPPEASKEGATRRLKVFAVSHALSARGIAPRWQKFASIETAASERLQAFRRLDAPYFDLAWLSIAYPNHRPKGSNLTLLFSEQLTERRVRAFVKRHRTADSGIRALQLSQEQQIGCRHYVSRQTLERWQTAQRKSYRYRPPTGTGKGRISMETLIERQLKIACLWFSKRRPMPSARMYNMATGRSITDVAMLSARDRYCPIRKPKSAKTSRRK